MKARNIPGIVAPETTSYLVLATTFPPIPLPFTSTSVCAKHYVSDPSTSDEEFQGA